MPHNPVQRSTRRSESVMTMHARRRAGERAISPEAIDFTLRHGKRLRRRGALYFYLGRRHIPRDHQADAAIRAWEGTTVVMANDESAILSVYRNRAGVH